MHSTSNPLPPPPFQRPAPRSEDVRQARGRYWESASAWRKRDGKEEGLVTKACVSWEWCWIFEGCSAGQNPHLILGNAGDTPFKITGEFLLWENGGKFAPALVFPHSALAQLRVIQCFESQSAVWSELSVRSKPSVKHLMGLNVAQEKTNGH